MEEHWTLPEASSSVGILVAISAALFWYYWKVVAPYSRFPSYHLDLQILYWILKGENLRTAILPKLVKVCEPLKEEGMCVMWLGQPIVFVFHEEYIRTFINDPTTTDKPNVYNLFKCVFANSILVSNGERYRKLKKILHPAFHVVALKGKVPTIQKYAAKMVDKIRELDDCETDDTMRLLQDSLLRSFVESSLGIDVRVDAETIQKSNFSMEIVGQLDKFISDRILSPWMYPDFTLKLFPSARRNLKLHHEGCKMTMELLEIIKESLCSTPKSEDDSDSYGQRSKLFGEILIEEHLKNPSFTMEDVLGQLSNLIAAGFDTTAHALLWCLFTLGHHPEVQEKAYQEVTSTTKGDVQYEDLRQLKYLECVIKETMRIYTILPIVARRLGRDMQCGKYNIPKGTTIAIFTHMLHRNPEIYPDPEKFDPERFMDSSKITQSNYIPFMESVRSCPGKVFAMMQMKIILAHILRNFRVVSVDRIEDVRVSWEILLTPAKSIRMKFLTRSDASVIPHTEGDCVQ